MALGRDSAAESEQVGIRIALTAQVRLQAGVGFQLRVREEL